MKQNLILVDDKDNILGYAPRREWDTGKRHRDFVVLIDSKNKKVLLQNRKHKLLDKLFGLAAASHAFPIGGIVISFFINLSAYYFTQNDTMIGLLLILLASTIGFLIYFISTKTQQ